MKSRSYLHHLNDLIDDLDELSVAEGLITASKV